MKRSALIVALLLTLAGAPPRLLAAEWYENYEKALDALNGQRWQEAVDLLTDAIGEKSSEKSNAKTYGLRFIDYFPYVYRGYAYYRLGNKRKALEDFERAERAGEVFRASDDKDAERILRDHLEILRRTPQEDPVLAEGIQLFRQKEYQRAIEKLRSIPSNSPSHAEAQRTIRMADAELRKLERAVAEPPPRDRVAQEYSAAVQLFRDNKLDAAERKFQMVLRMDKNHREAQDYLGKIAKAREEALVEASKRTLTRDQPRTEQRRPTSGPTAGRQAVEVSPGPPPGTPPSDALFEKGLAFYREGQLDKAREAFQQIRLTAPARHDVSTYLDSIAGNQERIKLGVAAYFKGDYRSAIEQLTEAARINRGSAQLYGYLASAYAARFLLSGEEEDRYRVHAVESYQKARALDATYTLDSRYISPRIIAMLNTP